MSDMKRRFAQDGLLSEIFIHLFMIIVVIITLYPFLNVLALSFNESADSTRNINMIFPRVPTLDNYKQLVKFQELGTGAVISVLRTVIGTFTGVLCAATFAYTLSRKDYAFRKPLGMIAVITMYVSGGIVPWYLLIAQTLNLDNTFWVYIIPSLISVWNVIVIRSFMDNLPMELQESAMLDGAGDFRIFAQIIFPLCTPVLATVALWIAVSHWNDWFITFIFNSRAPKLTTLQFELFKILDNTQAANIASATDAALRDSALGNRGISPMSVRMAITVVVTIPILLVYPFIQRYFVSGMTLGAVKA